MRLIKAADRGAAYFEATRLAGFEAAEARRFFGQPPKFSPRWSATISPPGLPTIAEERYRERLTKLTRE